MTEKMPPDGKNRKKSGGTVIAFLALTLLLAIVLSLNLGRYPITPRELVGMLAGRLGLLRGEPYWSETQQIALWNIRLPRILTAVFVGACLSAAGTAFQGVFQNPIAAPDILGASAGAGFGAALSIFCGFGRTGITASAFLMSLLTVLLVFFIGGRVKGDRTLGLVLAGIMVSSLFQAGTSFIKLVADPNDRLPAITYWLMGSLSGADSEELRFVFWPMLMGLIPLWLLRWRLNVLTMGDMEAHTMGVDAGKVRLTAVACSTLITAAAVSVSGMIGWVGLVIPHMMRRLVGSDFRILLPASVLGGGMFLLLVDDVSRCMASMEIPIGILTACIGAPVFLLLVTRRDAWYA